MKGSGIDVRPRGIGAHDPAKTIDALGLGRESAWKVHVEEAVADFQETVTGADIEAAVTTGDHPRIIDPVGAHVTPKKIVSGKVDSE